MFCAFMKRDYSQKNLSKGEGSDDKLMAYPGRYCKSGTVSLRNSLLLNLHTLTAHHLFVNTED